MSLGTKKEFYAGDTILHSQEIAKDNGFSHVAKIWYKQCISLDNGIDKMYQAQQTIHDIICPLSHFESTVENGKYGWRYKPNDRVYFPTPHALNNMSTLNPKGIASTWAVQALAGNNENESISRDHRDAEVLKHYLDVHIFQPDRVDQKKERLFRTWEDGTLRACLSTQYTIINNTWLLELIKEIIPGGMMSHWRSDADELWGNILIPDTIRKDVDSDYGGMLSVSNSEIGTRRISSMPSVFRAICMNGCIWDQESGKAIDKIHRGKNFDLVKFGEMIKHNLQTQIPLVTIGIDKMLETKTFKADNLNMIQLIGRAAMDYKLTNKELGAVIQACNIEEGILGNTIKTAFGLTAMITRAGQSLNNDSWVRCDKIGGEIMSMTRNNWDNFITRAKNVDDKDLIKLGLAV